MFVCVSTICVRGKWVFITRIANFYPLQANKVPVEQLCEEMTDGDDPFENLWEIVMRYGRPIQLGKRNVFLAKEIDYKWVF